MKRKRFSEEQIIGVLKEAEAGATWCVHRHLMPVFARPAGKCLVILT